jgi:hypothetical protein
MAHRHGDRGTDAAGTGFRVELIAPMVAGRFANCLSVDELRRSHAARGSWPTYRAAIEAEWRPYLQGHATMQQAISRMIDRMPSSVLDSP